MDQLVFKEINFHATHMRQRCDSNPTLSNSRDSDLLTAS